MLIVKVGQWQGRVSVIIGLLTGSHKATIRLQDVILAKENPCPKDLTITVQPASCSWDCPWLFMAYIKMKLKLGQINFYCHSINAISVWISYSCLH